VLACLRALVVAVQCGPEEGPCFDCYRTGEPSLCADVEVEVGRWPRFSAVARGAGFHATHALPLRLRGTIIGALNLFHADRGEMARADLNIGQAMADVAAIAILQHRAAQDAQVLNGRFGYQRGVMVGSRSQLGRPA
jgi:GAF domain-containing protein